MRRRTAKRSAKLFRQAVAASPDDLPQPPFPLPDYADNVGDEEQGDEKSFALRLRRLAALVSPEM